MRSRAISLTAVTARNRFALFFRAIAQCCHSLSVTKL